MNRAITLCVWGFASLMIAGSVQAGMILEFTPNVGTVYTDSGIKYVEVNPSVTPTITFTITANAEPAVSLGAFQLNFGNSDSALLLNNWVRGSSWSSTGDDNLDTSSNDTFIAGVSFSPVSVPAVLGTFQAKVPTVLGDYLLTLNRVSNPAANDDTAFGNDSYAAISLGDANFGDITIRAVPEPSVLTLLAVASVAIPGACLLRRRQARR
jgi:hypothetical protein